MAAVADCFSASKSSRKKSPDSGFNKWGDLPVLWPSNLEALHTSIVDRPRGTPRWNSLAYLPSTRRAAGREINARWTRGKLDIGRRRHPRRAASAPIGRRPSGANAAPVVTTTGTHWSASPSVGRPLRRPAPAAGREREAAGGWRRWPGGWGAGAGRAPSHASRRTRRAPSRRRSPRRSPRPRAGDRARWRPRNRSSRRGPPATAAARRRTRNRRSATTTPAAGAAAAAPPPPAYRPAPWCYLAALRRRRPPRRRRCVPARFPPLPAGGRWPRAASRRRTSRAARQSPTPCRTSRRSCTSRRCAATCGGDARWLAAELAGRRATSERRQF